MVEVSSELRSETLLPYVSPGSPKIGPLEGGNEVAVRSKVDEGDEAKAEVTSLCRSCC
jgi:hypothetical protein